MQSLLSALMNICKKISLPAIDLLQPGIDSAYIDEQISGLNIQLPPDVYTLYNWKNGTSYEAGTALENSWLFPGAIFYSLEDSIKSYHSYVGKDDFWREKMFLLFASGGGEMYLIDSDQQSGTYGMIYIHSVGELEFEVIATKYDSLRSLIESTIECYKKGAYFNDSGPMLDPIKSFDILKALNPASDYWKIYDKYR